MVAGFIRDWRSSMDTKMYVITHKKTKIPDIDMYSSMLVGASIHEEVDDQFDVKDNAGENISEKNPNYCELTGIYWIWKNAKVDNVGICHYRRFFSHKFIFGNKKYFLQGKDIERLLEKYSIIIPKPRCYEKTTLLSINYAPNMDDVKELYRAVKTCSPNYLDDFIWYFNQNKSYLYNMCIMRKTDFDAYCEWLFPILAYVEEIHDMEKETDPYRKRLFGFLSERLIFVWLHHNFADKEIREMPVINTDESDITRVRRLIGNITRQIFYVLTKNTKVNKLRQKDALNYVMNIT
jgi:hypothetical protein